MGTANPDLLPVGEEHSHLQQQTHKHELNAVDGEGKSKMDQIRKLCNFISSGGQRIKDQ